MSQNYNGYFITSCGRVWSYKSNRFLSLYKDAKGYKNVKINNQKKFIHRLVAETYLPNPDNFDTVDHIDCNKEHNYVRNLQWLSRSENSKKDKYKKVLCVETGQVYNSIAEAAISINKARSGISNCLYGRANTCGGYHWELI